MYGGLFLVTLATLTYETALTRIFSATMWYHFAFVAVSVALFGMTVGALLVHLLPNRFTVDRLQRNTWLYSLLFGISVAVGLILQLQINFRPHLTVSGMASVLETIFVIAVPFVFSGIVVCLVLTSYPMRIGGLYAADLIGGGLGCIALVVAFQWLDGPSLVMGIGAVAAAGSLVFALSGVDRRKILAAGMVMVVIGGFALTNAYISHHRRAPVHIVWAKEARDPTPLVERWNAFSRVTVGGDPNAPQGPGGYGMSTRSPKFVVNQLGMVIDSTAGTVLTRYSGNPAQSRFLRYDITNLAHYLRSPTDVMIVGVGGGRDVLSALQFNQRSVTGLEINSNVLKMTNKTYGDFTGHLDRIPNVHFVNDEARSWLARTNKRFGIMQISLIDTWAASGAGAYALSENSLYTTQAWKLFFDRLQPGGILSVSRWYNLPNTREPLEIFRTVSLASQALTERGVRNPRSHILVFRGPTVAFGASAATVMVSPQPFTASDLARIQTVTSRLAFTPVLTPTTAVDPRFAALTAPGGPHRALHLFNVDVSPPTDNRPFFFQMAGLHTLFHHAGVSSSSMSIQPVQTLAVLGIAVLILALICILLPLVLQRRDPDAERPSRGSLTLLYLFFAAIGLGFLLIEISQLQRLSIFLGHPVYALTVVLFSLLVFSGLGSAVSTAVIEGGQRRILFPLAALLVVLVVAGLITPTLLAHFDGSTTPVRILVAVCLLAPLGFTMGMPFPIGMRAAALRPGSPLAFLWGINGATSVVASVFGIVLSVFFGIAVAYWAGAIAYGVAAIAAVAIALQPLRAPAEVKVEQPSEERTPVSVEPGVL